MKFRPKFSWVDRVYLGNMLVETLGYLSKQTGVFDFDIVTADRPDSPET